MSCALCRLARTACNKEQPCGRCVRMGMAHHCFRPPSKRGRPPSRAPRPSEGQPVPLLPLHPAGAVGPDHAGLVASASNTPHLVPTATLFAAGMGTPLPSGIIHPAGDYDSSLALSSTASASLASTETSTSTSPSSTTSTSSTSSTSALVLGSISEVKSELAEVKDELSAVHMMQMEMREMKRRLGQLEEDNATLKGTVIELRTQVGGGGARFGQFRVDAAGGQQGPPLKKIRWMGHEALSPEMLWCFPFLEHINISRSNFVVDDLEKAILVLSFYPGKWTESTAFANQQFCNVSGFSLAELLERELVSVVAMADKLRIVRGWIKGKLTGYGDIVHCSYYIEHKAGHLVKVAARIQFFFDTTSQINYSVWCIDEVLGSEMPSVPFKEVRAKEMAEWHEASRSITINGSIQPAAVAAALAGGNGAAAATTATTASTTATTATTASTTTTPLAHTPQPHTQHTPPQHPTPPSQPSPQQQQQLQHQQLHYPPLHHSHSPPFQHQHQHQHQHHHRQGQSQPQPQPQQHSPPYTQHHPHQQHQQHQHQHSHQPRPSEPQAQHHSPTYQQQHQEYPAQLQQGGGGGGQTQSPPYTHAQHLQQQLQLQHQQQNHRHQPYQLYQQQQQQQLQLLLMQQDELDLLHQQQQQQHQQLATPTTAEVDEWREFLSISPSPSPGVFNYPGPPT